jgi:hypothetical protein
MKVPPDFKELYRQGKKLNEELRFMRVVLIPENYARENRGVLNDVEKILQDMVTLIQKIKQSLSSPNNQSTTTKTP